MPQQQVAISAPATTSLRPYSYFFNTCLAILPGVNALLFSANAPVATHARVGRLVSAAACLLFHLFSSPTS